MANKMVGQNKGKEGKSPRFDLGYKRNSTHECGNYDKKNERKREYTREESIACINRVPFPPSNIKPYSLQSLMDGYFYSHSKLLNFVS